MLYIYQVNHPIQPQRHQATERFFRGGPVLWRSGVDHGGILYRVLGDPETLRVAFLPVKLDDDSMYCDNCICIL